jgi:hypothetical protein
MMRKTLLVLTSMFALGSSSFGAPIPILALPYNISTPGNYVLNSNMSYTGTDAAITITVSPSLNKPVTVNLKGFTITGIGGFCTGVSIVGSGANKSSITVENGSIQNFGFGVWPEIAGSILTDITIDNVAFSNATTPARDGAGVLLSQVDDSTISNCTFKGGDYGIEDTLSTGGNRYINDSFISCGFCLFVDAAGGNAVLKRTEFDEPTN